MTAQRPLEGRPQVAGGREDTSQVAGGREDTSQVAPSFEGFVAGGAATTLPSQFFVDLLPRIDDEAELRVTLYALYAIARRRGPLHAVRASELAVEAPLRRTLAGCGGDAVLTPALERATARGSLLTLALDDGDTLCFVNSEAGRRSLARVRSGVAPTPDGVRLAAPRGDLASIDVDTPARVYEQEIGLLTPSTSAALAAACERYPEDWVTDALRVAARQNARSWAYAEAILRRWERDGKDDGGRSTQDATSRGTAAGAPRDHGPFERVIRRS